MTQDKKLQPIVEWAGGKRSLLDKIVPIIQETKYERYLEPFLGGGAVLFALAPKDAIVNDCNDELMNVYTEVRDSLDILIPLLNEHEKNNSESYFYTIRAMDRKPDYAMLSSANKAARFLYLNKTAYNGLYRVNKKCQCNMPYGKYVHPAIVNEAGLSKAAFYFNTNHIDLLNQDYSRVLQMATDRDVVYMDPPYMPVSISASFTAYNGSGFSFEEQKRLKHECDMLRDRGVSFIESNSDTLAIRELYQGYSMIQLTTRRSINSRGDKRSGAKELLIVSGRAEEAARRLGLLK